jgi:hypothetical protein
MCQEARFIPIAIKRLWEGGMFGATCCLVNLNEVASQSSKGSRSNSRKAIYGLLFLAKFCIGLVKLKVSESGSSAPMVF